MQLARAFAGLAIEARHCRNGIERGFERHRVVPVGTRDRDGQRNAARIYDDVSFGPDLPRSVGFGPVSWPPGGWKHWRHQDWPVPNQSGHAHATGEASPDAVAPTRLRPASPAAVASMSCHCRSPVPAAGLPMGCPFAAHTGCRSVLRAHPPFGVGHLWETG
ncbi:hypothetical protein FHX58_006367 [Paraburkholderia tropica]|nr:hypothetical protein [Paraburkholderia tropica]